MMESPSQNKRGTGDITIDPGETVLTAFPYKPHTSLLDVLTGEPKVLGAVHILLALVIVGLGLILLFNYISFSQNFPLVILIGYPFWGALIFFLAGFFTITNAKSIKVLGQGVTTINILSALAAIAGIALIIISFAQQHDFCKQPSLDGACGMGRSLLLGILSVLLIITIAELSISVTIASFRCKYWTSSDEVVFFLPSGATQNGEQLASGENAQLQFELQEKSSRGDTTSNLQAVYFGGYTFFKLRVLRSHLAPPNSSQICNQGRENYQTLSVPVPDEQEQSIPPPFQSPEEETEPKPLPPTLEPRPSNSHYNQEDSITNQVNDEDLQSVIPVSSHHSQRSSKTSQRTDEDLQSAILHTSEMQAQMPQDEALSPLVLPTPSMQSLQVLLPEDLTSPKVTHPLSTKALQSEPPPFHLIQSYDIISGDLPSQDILSQDSSSQDTLSQDSPPQDTPFQDSPAQDTPFQDSPSQDTPHQDSPSQDTPYKDSPSQDTPYKDSPSQDTPYQDSPSQDTPYQDSPSQDTPFQDSPSQDTPFQDSPSQDTPYQDSPSQDTPYQDSPSQDTTFQDSLSQDTPYQDILTQDIASLETPSQNIPTPNNSPQNVPSEDFQPQSDQPQSWQPPEITYKDIRTEVMELTQEWKSNKEHDSRRSSRRFSMGFQMKNWQPPPKIYSFELQSKAEKSPRRYSLDLKDKSGQSPRRKSLDQQIKSWIFPKKRSINKEEKYTQTSEQSLAQQSKEEELPQQQSQDVQHEDQQAKDREDVGQQADKEKLLKEQIQDQQAGDHQAPEEKAPKRPTPYWQDERQQAQVRKVPRQFCQDWDSQSQASQDSQIPQKTCLQQATLSWQSQDWKSQGWRNKNWKPQEWQFEMQSSFRDWGYQELEKEALRQKALYQETQNTTAQTKKVTQLENFLFQIGHCESKDQEDNMYEDGTQTTDNLPEGTEGTCQQPCDQQLAYVKPDDQPSSQSLVPYTDVISLSNVGSEQEVPQENSSCSISEKELNITSSSCYQRDQQPSEESD